MNWLRKMARDIERDRARQFKLARRLGLVGLGLGFRIAGMHLLDLHQPMPLPRTAARYSADPNHCLDR